MDLEDWHRLHDRLDSAHRATVGTQIGVREFWIMHRNIYQKLQQANAEWINCRRRGIGSPRFDQLLIEAEENLRNFEGYILIAKLMHKEQT